MPFLLAVWKKKVDKGTASRSLLLKTKCLLKNRERGSEGWFVWGRVAGFLFFEVPIFRGHTGRSGGTLTVPDAFLPARSGSAPPAAGRVGKGRGRFCRGPRPIGTER